MTEDSTEQDNDPIVIPPTELADDTLARVIESFILREGTDYGFQETQLQTKVDQVRLQLQRGEARIVFDPETSTIDIQRTNAAARRA